MGRIKDEFIKEMKEFCGSSFMTAKELTEWSGRSKSYVDLLVLPLDWIQASSRTRLFFIPDVAEAIERRISSEGVGKASPGVERSTNRAAYQDHIIGKKAREQGVAPKYSKEFKDEALALSDEIGARAAARKMGINSYTLNGWRYARDTESGNVPKNSKPRREMSRAAGKCSTAAKGRKKRKSILDENDIVLPFICV